MGKVNAVYEIKTWSGHEDSYSMLSETGFLYSSFDGEKMVYRLYIPSEEEAYDVVHSSLYSGAQIKWTHNGKHITHVPLLGEMYTHYAGPYYFNVSSVIK